MSDSTSKVHICSYLTEAPPRSGPLFTCDGASTDLQSAQTRVLALSNALRTHLDIQNGDRICTLARTTPQHLETLLAITASGSIAAPLNWRWSTDEAGYAVDLISASVLVADRACLPLATALAEKCTRIKALIIIGPGDESMVEDSRERGSFSVPFLSAENLIRSSSQAKTAQPTALRFAPEGACFIIFTSGTSGRPRAALITHKAMHFQCQAKLRCCGYSASDVYLHSAALFHVGGLCSALAMMLAGAAHIFLPAFSAKEALSLMREYNVTCTIAVPTMISDVLAVSRSPASLPRSVRLPSVRYILVGAGGMSSAALNDLATLMPNATIASAYGMTEGCSSITFNTLLDRTAAGGTSHLSSSVPPPSLPSGSHNGVYVGKPPQGIELGILEEETSPFSALGSIEIHTHGLGEILTKGPHLAVRYWGDPDATSAHFLPTGWFRTGDLGVLNKGHLWLVGRAKDTIKSGGENVAAAEVERALLYHPAVANAAVLGLPHERLAEVVAAVVVLQPGWKWKGPQYQIMLPGEHSFTNSYKDTSGSALHLSGGSSLKEVDAAVLQNHCREMKLSGFKLPRVVVVLDALPINATGKVVKSQLKEQILRMQVAAAPVTATHRSKL